MEAVSMVTASINYELTDNAQLFLEGNNLLGESNRTFQGRSDLPGSIQVYGRTIKFGARYTF
jgi:outer membrane receptor protein involved in Fe transport